jgi:hypothetical protein
MNAFVAWMKDKWGRLMTLIGGLSLLLDYIPADVSPVAMYLQTLVGQRWLSIVGLACFAISYMRHQKAAKTVAQLQARIAELEKPQ